MFFSKKQKKAPHMIQCVKFHIAISVQLQAADAAQTEACACAPLKLQRLNWQRGPLNSECAASQLASAAEAHTSPAVSFQRRRGGGGEGIT